MIWGGGIEKKKIGDPPLGKNKFLRGTLQEKN